MPNDITLTVNTVDGPVTLQPIFTQVEDIPVPHLTESNFNLTGLPASITSLIEAVKEWPCVRDKNLVKLRDHFIGGEYAKRACYHPMPQGEIPRNWELIRRFLLVPNPLTKKAVTRFCNALFSGTILKRINRSTHKDEMQAFVDDPCFEKAFYSLMHDAILYGTAYFVPVLMQDDPDEPAELEIWEPDPILTYLICNPMNVKDVRALVEFVPYQNAIRFLTPEGMGWVSCDATPVFKPFGPEGLGFLPVVIARGIEQVGSQYGLSLVAEAPDYAIRVADIAKNLSQLQKHQTASPLVLIGNEGDMPDLQEVGGPAPVYRMTHPDSAGTGGGRADAKYITPDAKFSETLNIVDYYITQLASALGIPKDGLDANVYEKNASAEAAKLRSSALNSTVKRLIATGRQLLTDIVTRCTGVLLFRDNGNQPVKLKALSKILETEVIFHASARPETMAEVVAPYTQLLQAGGITPEDYCRFFNETKSDAEIQAMADEIRASKQAVIIAATTPVITPIAPPDEAPVSDLQATQT